MKINEKNLCVFATSPPYDCEGFLSKRGEVNKSFLRRYFVLKGNLLFYFEKKGDKEPLGLIIVEGCSIELSEESDHQYCFEIAFNGNRTYVLCAETQESMERWMKTLTCAGYEYKKLMLDELQRKLEEIEGSRDKMLTENAIKTTTVLKPPRRRQNPFNRPAPPVPGQNGNEVIDASTSANIYMPFKNGSSLASHAANSSVSPMPRSTKSEFYIPEPKSQQVPENNDVMSSSQAGSSCSRVKKSDNPISSQQNGTTLPNHNHNNSKIAVENFERMHEQFRQLIMKDVLEYRAQQVLIQSKPLIEL